MLLDDLAAYLQGNGIGTVGTDLLKGLEPDQPDNCVTLYDTGGFPASTPVLPDLRRTVQVRVRDKSFPSGHSRIWAIFNLLDRPEDRLITTNGRRLAAQAMQPPQFLERDASNRCIFVFNLAAWTGRD